MSTPLVVPHTQERMRLPTLRIVMIASLVGTVLVYILLQTLIIYKRWSRHWRSSWR